MDEIYIRGLQCYGYHGVFPEERAIGQRFVVHLRLKTDLRNAGETDDLSQSIDYGQVSRVVQQIVEGPPVQLIERLAERIAQTLLEQFPTLAGVEVDVVKPGAPVPVPFHEIGVHIERWRPGR